MVLKGRIYEHRCDLSRSGQKLIYFVGGYRNVMRTRKPLFARKPEELAAAER